MPSVLEAKVNITSKGRAIVTEVAGKAPATIDAKRATLSRFFALYVKTGEHKDCGKQLRWGHLGGVQTRHLLIFQIL
jgi:hypothetical protein